MKEQADLRKQIALQEMEISRMKDESTLTLLKHQDEVKYLREKHDSDVKDIDKRKNDEINSVDKRHQEAIQALKRIQLDEIASVRERGKDNAAFDTLATQLQVWLTCRKADFNPRLGLSL